MTITYPSMSSFIKFKPISDPPPPCTLARQWANRALCKEQRAIYHETAWYFSIRIATRPVSACYSLCCTLARRGFHFLGSVYIICRIKINEDDQTFFCCRVNSFYRSSLPYFFSVRAPQCSLFLYTLWNINLSVATQIPLGRRMLGLNTTQLLLM